MTLGKLNRAISIKDSDTPQSEPGKQLTITRSRTAETGRPPTRRPFCHCLGSGSPAAAGSSSGSSLQVSATTSWRRR